MSELPTCPYCGDVDREPWDREALQDGRPREVTCAGCDQPYMLTLHVTHSYSTAALDGQVTSRLLNDEEARAAEAADDPEDEVHES